MVAGLESTFWTFLIVGIVSILSTTLVLSLLTIPVLAQVPCTNWNQDLDTDCDGLSDEWEETGYDYDGDLVVDLTLPGANKNHKDIYLEIDYMQISGSQTHKPRPGVVDAVVAAFATAPVVPPNPDGLPGVNLHVTVDEPIPHQNSISMWADFDGLKNIWFGTPTEKNNNNPNTILAKDNTYHYALFIHQYNGISSSGTAELPGDDFVVSLGASGWGTNNGHTVGSLDQQKGTLMHELGHNLGLRHGGNIDENCKPNYLSVMSYSFQFSDYVGTRPLDYSRSQLNMLNESRLVEPDGVSPASDPVGLRTVYGPSSPLVSPQLLNPLNPINWDRDSNPSETQVVRNINNLGTGNGCSSTLTTLLAGFDDWANLKFWGTVGGWGNGTTPDLATVPNFEVVGNISIPSELGNLSVVGDIGNLSVSEYLSIPSELGNLSVSEYLSIPSELGNLSVVGGIGNLSVATNLTNTGKPIDSREGLDEKDVENMYSVRQSHREKIEEVLTSFDDQDFKNPGSQSKNMLIGQTRALANILSTPNAPQQAVIVLLQIISRMDGSFQGNPADDLLINPEKQQIVVPELRNFADILLQQQ